MHCCEVLADCTIFRHLEELSSMSSSTCSRGGNCSINGVFRACRSTRQLKVVSSVKNCHSVSFGEGARHHENIIYATFCCCMRLCRMRNNVHLCSRPGFCQLFFVRLLLAHSHNIPEHAPCLGDSQRRSLHEAICRVR